MNGVSRRLFAAENLATVTRQIQTGLDRVDQLRKVVLAIGVRCQERTSFHRMHPPGL